MKKTTVVALILILAVLVFAQTINKEYKLTETQQLKFENYALKIEKLQVQVQQLNSEMQKMYESVCNDNKVPMVECKLTQDFSKIIQQPEVKK